MEKNNSSILPKNQIAPILVVDDEAEILEILKNIVAVEGLNCLTATSAEKAIDLLRTQKISLVFLDWGLSGAYDSSGALVLRACREVSSLLPVIVMSGLPRDVRSEAISERADVFLQKPFTYTNVREVLRRWLERSTAAQHESLPQTRDAIVPLKEFKCTYIQHVVRMSDNNISLAAERLKVDRQTVSSALKVT